MKFPAQPSQVSPASAYHAPQPSRLAFGSSEALATLARTAARIGEDLGDIQRAERTAEQKRQAAEAHAEATDLQAQTEVAITQGLADIRRSETDPDTYYQKASEYIDQTSVSFTQQARKPGAAAMLNERLSRVIPGLKEKAVAHVDVLRVQNAEATATRTANNGEALSAVLPWDDPEEQGRAWATIAGGLAAAAPYKGAAWVQEQTDARKRAFVLGIAEREKDADPQGFLEHSDRYAFLGAPKVQQLRREAQTKIVADERTHREAMEKFYTRIEQEAEGERQAQLTALDEKARAGRMTTEDLRLARIMRIVTKPSELDHLAALINAPPNRPSHPDDLRVIGADVRSLTPRTRDTDIRAAMAEHARSGGARGLSIQDGLGLIDRLRENDQRKDDKSHQLRGERYRAALDEGRKRLGITSAFETLDPLTKKLDADFTADMNARSNWLNEQGDDSMKVLGDVLPQYMAAQRSDTRLHFDTQVRLIPQQFGGPMPPTREVGGSAEQAWSTWFQAASQRVEAVKSRDPALYQRVRLQLLELKAARQRMVDNEIRSSDLPKAGAGGGATGRLPVSVP